MDMKNEQVLENVKCSKNQTSKFSCCSKDCQKYAFICQNQSCQCQKQHSNCLIVKTQSIVKKLYGKVISTKQLQACIETGFQKIIEELSNFRQQTLESIQERFELCGLCQNQKQFISQMRSGKTSGITGNKLWEAHLNFQPEPQISKKIQLTMKNIDQHLAGLKNSLKKPCADIRSSIDNFGVLSGSILKQSEKSLIAKNSKNQLQNLKNFHSKYFNTQKYFWGSKVIINLQEVISMIGFFDGKKIKSTALLYRASQNGFDLGKFHEKCDCVPCTLTICETQFSKKIGGYTPIQWKKLSSITYQKDDSGQSFVFSLSNNDKFILQEKQKAVCHRNDDYGPHLGNLDFILCNKSNQSRQCYGRINYSYVNNKYKKDDKQSWERFIGSSSNTHYFTTKQWQVWKIEFEV